MFPRPLSALRMVILTGAVFMCMAFSPSMSTGTLSNGLNEWVPSEIQGTVMDVGRGTIAIAEQWVMIMDTSYRGKTIRTRFFNPRRDAVERVTFKSGMIVYAKGGLAWDDQLKANVLLATEIHVLDRKMDLSDEEQRKRYFSPAAPW